MSDMLYYYALFATSLIVLVSLIKVVTRFFPKLE